MVMMLVVLGWFAGLIFSLFLITIGLKALWSGGNILPIFGGGALLILSNFLLIICVNSWIWGSLTGELGDFQLTWGILLLSIFTALLLPTGLVCWGGARLGEKAANMTEEISDKVFSKFSKYFRDIKFERYAAPFVIFGRSTTAFCVYLYTVCFGALLWKEFAGIEKITMADHGLAIGAAMVMFGIGLVMKARVRIMLGMAFMVVACLVMFQSCAG